jgi:hypothetical protein
MKFFLSPFGWGRKFAVAALAFAVMIPGSQAQNLTLSFDTGDEIDTVTFDPAKISEANLRELMLLSPYIVEYFNQLPAKDMWASGSITGTIPYKNFYPLSLEFCEPTDVSYAHCEANEVVPDPNQTAATVQRDSLTGS